VRIRRFHNAILAILSLAALSSAEALAQKKATPSYTFTDLGGLPGLSYVESEAYAINDAGEIVGLSYTAGPSGPVPHAVVWAMDATGKYVMTDLGADVGTARGINSQGEVVTSLGFLVRPVDINDNLVWYQDLNGDGVNDLEIPLGDNDPNAYAISDNTQIAAASELIQFDARGNENITQLPNGGSCYAINDFGEVAGHDQNGAVLWQVDAQGVVQETYSLPPLPGYYLSNALCIDALGQAAGESFYHGNGTQNYAHATLWQGPNAAPIDLGVLTKNGSSQAWGIATTNTVTQVVGWASVSTGSTAFLWKDGVMTDLNRLISASGVSLQIANAVNSHGQIVGFAHVTVGKNVETHAFLLTPK
jgi:probable HAF family extracellular repeat protein